MLIKLIAILLFVTVPEDNVSLQVNNFFRNKLSAYDSFKVEFLNKPADISSITFLSDYFDKTKNLICLPAEIKFNNGKTSKTFLSFRLSLYRKVLFSDCFIGKNAELKPGFFTYKETEINSIKGTPVYSESEILNTESKKEILPGEMLIKEFVEQIPIIQPGDNITANIISGSTVVSFDVIARQEGIAGQVIRVLSKDKKQYKAKIADRQNVIIVE